MITDKQNFFSSFRDFANRGTEGLPPQYPAANTLLNLYRKSHEEEMPEIEFGVLTLNLLSCHKIKIFFKKSNSKSLNI